MESVLQNLKDWEIIQVNRSNIAKVNALARLAMPLNQRVETLKSPSTECANILEISDRMGWRDPILEYTLRDTILGNKMEGKEDRHKAAW